MQNNHKQFNCKFCSISVKGLNELKKHEKQHHEKESYTYEQCAQSFTRKDRLEAHMQNNHQSMMCEFCGFIVKGVNELQKHVNQQHQKEKEKENIDKGSTFTDRRIPQIFRRKHFRRKRPQQNVD